jgi:hypothetical protein
MRRKRRGAAAGNALALQQHSCLPVLQRRCVTSSRLRQRRRHKATRGRRRKAEGSAMNAFAAIVSILAAAAAVTFAITAYVN